VTFRLHAFGTFDAVRLPTRGNFAQLVVNPGPGGLFANLDNGTVDPPLVREVMLDPAGNLTVLVQAVLKLDIINGSANFTSLARLTISTWLSLWTWRSR